SFVVEQRPVRIWRWLDRTALFVRPDLLEGERDYLQFLGMPTARPIIPDGGADEGRRHDENIERLARSRRGGIGQIDIRLESIHRKLLVGCFARRPLSSLARTARALGALKGDDLPANRLAAAVDEESDAKGILAPVEVANRVAQMALGVLVVLGGQRVVD